MVRKKYFGETTWQEGYIVRRLHGEGTTCEEEKFVRGLRSIW